MNETIMEIIGGVGAILVALVLNWLWDDDSSDWLN